MRIFEKDSKTNFVDEADVLVGFDSYQCCCESFGHYFVTDPEHDHDNEVTPTNLEALFFDHDFFKEREHQYEGGEVLFRLFDPQDADVAPIYLVLYNHHNGYYSHGFSMETGGTDLHSGSI